MRRIQVAGTVLSLACLAFAFCPNYERTAQEYGFPSWRGMTKDLYARTLSSLELPNLAIQTNDHAFTASYKARGRFFRAVIMAKEGERELLRIEKIVATNVVAAQEQLVNCMAGFSAGNYSSATNDIGDRGYGVVTRYHDFVAFSRNNVFISVSSLTNMYSAASLARLIDADILQKSKADE